jgi:hypothetical protein
LTRSVLADSFASSLNESELAKFRWAKVPKVSIGPSFEYCGMVNVKNSNGIYDGMQPFLGTITTTNGIITGGAIASIDTGNPRGKPRSHSKTLPSEGVESVRGEIGPYQKMLTMFIDSGGRL